MFSRFLAYLICRILEIGVAMGVIGVAAALTSVL
jgi:hypothetical protein